MSTGSPLPRVVVDTSTVVSGVIIRRGYPRVLVDAWYGGAFCWLMTPAIFAEYTAVLHRPGLLATFNATVDEVDDFLRLVTLLSER